MMSWASVEGLPLPLGATWAADDRAYNFAIYARHAGQVTLLLYGNDLRAPVLTHRFDPGRNKSGHVWHCRIPATAVAGARYYAYSIDGPRSAPHQFDPDKILFDPYARAIFFPPEFDREAARRPGSNAGRAPVGLLVAGPTECNFDWGDDRHPRHEANTVVYELHVGAFTAHPSSGVKDERRGTYAGLIVRPRAGRAASDRRAVGRCRRVPARPGFPRHHLGAMERPVPRRRAAVRARRPGNDWRDDAATVRKQRPLPG